MPANGQIGSQSFILFQGSPHAFGMRVEDITRPGADGNAFRQIAQRSAPYQVETLGDSTSAAGLKSLKDAYEAMKGTVVNVVDAFGNIHSNHVVLEVVPVWHKFSSCVIGGVNVASCSPGWLLRARWTLQAGGTP